MKTKKTSIKQQLHCGTGKTTAKLARITCFHEGGATDIKGGFLYVTTQEEIERCDLSRYMENFGPQISTERMRLFQGRVLWTIHGYEANPRPLCAIPEVRKFYAEAHRRWPVWLFFSDLQSACLQVVARSIIANDTTAKHGCCAARGSLRSFFTHSLPPVAWFHKRLGISPKDGVRQLQKVRNYLGLPE